MNMKMVAVIAFLAIVGMAVGADPVLVSKNPNLVGCNCPTLIPSIGKINEYAEYVGYNVALTNCCKDRIEGNITGATNDTITVFDGERVHIINKYAISRLTVNRKNA